MVVDFLSKYVGEVSRETSDLFVVFGLVFLAFLLGELFRFVRGVFHV